MTKKLMLIAGIILLILGLCLLSGCTGKIKLMKDPLPAGDANADDLSSRACIQYSSTFSTFGWGMGDAGDVALDYIYNSKELAKKYGNTFEVSDVGGTSDNQTTSLFMYKGTGTYFVKIKGDYWIVELSKGYFWRWEVTKCYKYVETKSSADIKAEQTVQKVIDAINNKDAQALKAMFSKNALKESGNIDKSISELFAFTNGKIKLYNIWMGDGITRYNEKENGLEGMGFICRDTNKIKYTVYIYGHGDKNSPDIGRFYSLQIAKIKDEDDYYDESNGKPIVPDVNHIGVVVWTLDKMKAAGNKS